MKIKLIQSYFIPGYENPRKQRLNYKITKNNESVSVWILKTYPCPNPNSEKKD